MPVFTQNDFNSLRGLRASDRSIEEQKSINETMGYRNDSIPTSNFESLDIQESEQDSADLAHLLRKKMDAYTFDLNAKYKQALAENRERFSVGRNSVNTSANDYLDKIASENSSYYKKYKDTDKLPITDQDKKKLAAEYDARKKTYGEDNANTWLDGQFKNIVGNNQSWWEQAVHAVSHLVPAIEGGLIQTYGMLHGAIAHIAGAEGYEGNPDLAWYNNFINNVIDNPITRYGRDIELSGTSHLSDALKLIGLSDQTANEAIAARKATATKYNPEGIGNDAIVTTQEQDDAWFSSATIPQALQSGGFTALSMLTGAAEAKAANWLFSNAARGASWLNKTGKILKTEEALEKTLEGLKKAQNFTNLTIIPGTVGSVEGALEGLNTKIDVEREAVQSLDEYYKDKVNREVEKVLNDDKQNPLVTIQTENGPKQVRMLDQEEAFRRVWDQYKDEYNEARRHIDWASSLAGVQNFWANSLINGMMNQTLKAGLMAPRVQETLRNSKMFGWAYKNPKFKIDDATNTVTPKFSKLGSVLQVLKEPSGEGFEEFLQSLSNDVFSGAAENNINEFVKNKFDGDGTARVAEMLGSDWAAAATAFTGSLMNKESWESAILGAVSSTLGTVGSTGRGYHRDENGRIVQNSAFDPRNLLIGIDSNGNRESLTDYARRVTPWRSGFMNAVFDRRQEMVDAKETAAALTDWLQTPENRAKWDGLQGTANWLRQMEKAAESNDQFSYRKAQMGKAVNDVIMLSKLEGTQYYESFMQDLQKAADGRISAEEVETLRNNGGEEYKNVSDEEIIEKVQSNANKMLGLMTQVEEEGKHIDRMIGRVDEDTKQSLIYGKIMSSFHKERRDQIKQELEGLQIASSKPRSNANVDEDLKNVIVRYGTINKALRELDHLQEKKEKTEKRIEELEAIGENRTTDGQKEDLIKGRNALKIINRQIESLKPLQDKEGNTRSELASMVLNEEEIMALDPVTRATMIAQGSTRLYNATHQNRQRVDQLNLELDELNRQIEDLEADKAKWITPEGKTKKHHHKQVERTDKELNKLKNKKAAKMRELNIEQGDMNAKPVYSQAQQEVIDNLMEQGMSQLDDFQNKVVDMGRIDLAIKAYHQQYQAILSDPKAFSKYVKREQAKAAADLVRRRAERIASIEDFQKFSQELDRVAANSSVEEARIIRDVLTEKDAKRKQALNNGVNEEDGQLVIDDNGTATTEWKNPKPAPQSNYERYKENVKQRGELINQFVKNPNLTDNDISLLEDAMEYLQSKGIGLTEEDRDAAVEALVEEDEQGNMGGKFREFVESRNANMLPQQRAYMPTFTSIGQIVGHYVNLLNGKLEDDINKGNLHRTITPVATPKTVANSTPAPSPTPSPTAVPDPQAAATAGLFALGAASQRAVNPEDIDQTNAQQAQEQHPQVAQQEKTAVEQFHDLIYGNIDGDKKAGDEAKELIKQYFNDSDVTDVEDLLADMEEKRLTLKEQFASSGDSKFDEAATLMATIASRLEIQKNMANGGATQQSQREENPNASTIRTANIAYLEQKYGDIWPVVFSRRHNIDGWNRNHTLDPKTDQVYFITDSEWTRASMQDMGEEKYDDTQNKPVVIAVKVDTPTNTATTTALEVNGEWYQPIGILPSVGTESLGAQRTKDIRGKASQEQGRHLITEDGLPNGRPLTTTVNGANYRTAEFADNNRDNSKENNRDVLGNLIQDTAKDNTNEAEAIAKASKDELFDINSVVGMLYARVKAKFLSGLYWEENPGKDGHHCKFKPDRLRPNSDYPNGIGIEEKKMSETVGRTTGTPLLETLQNGTPSDIATFNSRTERLYKEVLKPLFTGSRAARVFTLEDFEGKNPQEVYKQETERLEELLNKPRGLRGVNDFIYVNPSWSFEVTVPQSLQKVSENPSECEAVYQVFLKHTDGTEIPIGEIKVRPNLSEGEANAAALDMLRNFMYDEGTNSIRNFLRWQLPAGDIKLLNDDSNPTLQDRARSNIGALVDDGILMMAGSTTLYDPKSITIRAPKAGGKASTTPPVVANPDNAQPASPINVTPQAEGSVVTQSGEQIEPNSGVTLESPTPVPTPSATGGEQETPQAAAARKIAEKIIADSREFKLSEDEVYYYIEDKKTGQRTKYLRVTTVIGADESIPSLLTEKEAEKEKNWVPTVENVVSKLKQTHPEIPNLSAAQIKSFKNIELMAKSLGISEAEIRKAVAILRTEHKREGIGVWGTPSTLIGDTMDTITRDFLAGHLKDSYPNITKEALDRFVEQLSTFKSDLNSKGIHILSEGIMAHGTITMTDYDGSTREVKVGGTLDLFGYDDKGSFYIFDMKTTRNHSEKKLEEESNKWSRQISMYADLLKQQYNIDVDVNNLRIIPINVSYPAPMGNGANGTSLTGPEYIKGEDGQLMQKYKHNDPKEYNMPLPSRDKESNGDNSFGLRNTTLEGQYQPGYTPLHIRWDQLSSEDQEIAEAMLTAVAENTPMNEQPVGTPKEAKIEKEDRYRSPTLAEDTVLDSDFDDYIPPTPQAAPVVPNGERAAMPSWEDLMMHKNSKEIIAYLEENEYIERDSESGYKESYLEFLNDPEEVALAYKELKECHFLL